MIEWEFYKEGKGDYDLWVSQNLHNGQVQRHYCDRAMKQIFEANELFLEFVKDGMTRRELQRNIDRNPRTWGRFANWLDKLPE